MTHRGMTLIETVLYVALFALIFTTVITFALAIGESNKKAQERNVLSRSLLFVSSHLTSTFETADSINDSGCVFNDNNGRVSMVDEGLSVVYSLSDGRLIFTSPAGSSHLTPSGLTVTRFLIQPVYTRSSELTGIRVSLDVAGSNGQEEMLVSSFVL